MTNLIKRFNLSNRFTLITLSLILTIILAATILTIQPSTPTVTPDTTQLHYIITSIEGNEYYGTSTSDDTNIYFTSDMIKGEAIQVGNTVAAHIINIDTAEEELIQVNKK